MNIVDQTILSYPKQGKDGKQAYVKDVVVNAEGKIMLGDIKLVSKHGVTAQVEEGATVFDTVNTARIAAAQHNWYNGYSEQESIIIQNAYHFGLTIKIGKE